MIENPRGRILIAHATPVSWPSMIAGVVVQERKLQPLNEQAMVSIDVEKLVEIF
jgi:hypothetical protein